MKAAESTISTGGSRGLIPLLVDEVRSEHLGRARALDQLAQLVRTHCAGSTSEVRAALVRAGCVRSSSTIETAQQTARSESSLGS